MDMSRERTEKKILTVSELSQQIRNCLESEFPSVWIKGELSNFIAHSSGHWYFSLKDEKSQIKGVMFRGQNHKAAFLPKNGMEVLVQGQLSLYPPRGDYQILCQEIELLGSGSLQQKFETIKRKLKEEGLFDKERKKPLPLFPKHIGLITSPTGAAVRDILQVLNRRFKAVKVTLIPSLVQGEEAPASLLKSLSLSKHLDVDVLILARGGGSIEDLWGFNEENLARAIAKHPIPVISAVGHEIDFTICDFVADLRAATPSAGAELVVQNRDELLNKLDIFKKQFIQNLKRQLYFLKEKLSSLEKSLIRPDRYLQDFSQRLDEVNSRLQKALNQTFHRTKENLNHLEKFFNSLNPKKVLQRGFSIVTTEQGDIVYDIKELQIKDSVHINFFKGQAKATINKKEPLDGI